MVSNSYLFTSNRLTMCYDIKASLESQLKRAQRKGDAKAIEDIKKKLVPLTDLPLFHASGFSHPKLLIYSNRSPDMPEVATWGLIPHWVKDREQSKKYWNNTLNARGETLFEKPSFRDAAQHHPCLIYVDGFYEHHHYNGKSYPFFIQSKDHEPLILAGVWNEWLDRETGELLTTFTIVTTAGNKMLSKIHNNPKLKEPRMPVLLHEEWANNWLQPSSENTDVDLMKSQIRPYPDDTLEAYTVHKLRGHEYLGNVPEICEKVTYQELRTETI